MLSYMLMKEKLVAGCQCAMDAQPPFMSFMTVVHRRGSARGPGVSWSLSIRPGLHVPQHRRGGCSSRFMRE